MSDQRTLKRNQEPCPLCGSMNSSLFLSLKDYSISGEDFCIYSCSACSFKFTGDAPSEDSIAPYYRAEQYISHTETQKGFISNL
jgi:hypothetical protein